MRYLLNLLLAGTMTVSFSVTVFAQSTIGTAVSVDDTVTGNNKRIIRTAAKVSVNERIRSNSSGLGHFKFNDGTKLVVGPGTDIVLDELIYNPNGSSFKKFVLKTGAGATRFISGNSNSSAYEINTPVGTLGIRGTAFDIQHFKGRTFVLLVSGRLEFCNFAGDCQIIRRKCDFIVADRNGKISKPKQPKDSIFKKVDMIGYFPFIADQSDLEEDFKLRTKTCGLSGGSFSQTFKGRPDTSGNGGTETGGGGSDPGGSGNSGGSSGSGDAGGNSSSSDAGDAGSGDTGGNSGNGDAGDTGSDQ